MTARKEPPLPDKVKVGPLTFDVTDDAMSHVLAEHEEKTAGLYGRCDYKKQAIVLDPGMAPGQYRATLLHEVLHAVFHTSGGRFDNEEEIVGEIEFPLLGVLRDNPALVAYLTGGAA